MLPHAEFVSQMAYYREFPWGDDWQQTRALHATVLSASPRYRPFSLERYFPQPRQGGGGLAAMFQSMKAIAIERGTVC